MMPQRQMPWTFIQQAGLKAVEFKGSCWNEIWNKAQIHGIIPFSFTPSTVVDRIMFLLFSCLALMISRYSSYYIVIHTTHKGKAHDANFRSHQRIPPKSEPKHGASAPWWQKALRPIGSPWPGEMCEMWSLMNLCRWTLMARFRRCPGALFVDVLILPG